MQKEKKEKNIDRSQPKKLGVNEISIKVESDADEKQDNLTLKLSPVKYTAQNYSASINTRQ